MPSFAVCPALSLPMPALPFLDSNGVRAPSESTDRYFRHSACYHIKYECTAELIRNPAKHDPIPGYAAMTRELWDVLLEACGQDESRSDYYHSIIHIEKIAVFVDYLLVVRKHGRPVAFMAGTFISREWFYFNTAVVIPRFQEVGLGSIMTGLFCHTVIHDAARIGIDPFFVCRTQNRKVLQALLGSFVNGKISTEAGLPDTHRDIFQTIAARLGCGIDSRGISRNVYPAGMPKCENEIKDPRIQQATAALGPQDACYVAGRINRRLVELFFKRNVLFQAD